MATTFELYTNNTYLIASLSFAFLRNWAFPNECQTNALIPDKELLQSFNLKKEMTTLSSRDSRYVKHAYCARIRLIYLIVLTRYMLPCETKIIVTAAM